jgi:TRAP-type C4-dicarboxylate transport system substrate-binding protein
LETGGFEMKKMILSSLATVVLLAAGMMAGPGGVCAETIELKMAHFMSPMHIQHQQSFLPFAKKVEELTGGKIKIRVYPSGTLGDATQLADSVRTGISDIAFFVPSYMTGRFPRTSALDLPFLFDNAEHTTRVFYDLFDRYLAEDYKDYKVLWLYSCDAGQFFSVEKPIRTLEDLKGMKIRTPSAHMTQTLKLLGANPVGMPLSDLHAALGKKIIDGTLAPTSAIYDFKLENLIRHSARLNVYTAPMVVVMNRAKFNSLPQDARKAIEQASGRQWGLRAARLYDDLDADTVRKMKATGKINIYTLPAAEIRKHMDRVKVMEAEWIEKAAQKGLPAREMMEALHRSAAGNRAK